MEEFIHVCQEKRITSISFPQLGCGNGDLEWADVKPLMERYLKGLPAEIFVHIYPSRAVAKLGGRVAKTTKEWLATQPNPLDFTEIWGGLVYAVDSNHEFVTLDEGQDVFNADIFHDKRRREHTYKQWLKAGSHTKRPDARFVATNQRYGHLHTTNNA